MSPDDSSSQWSVNWRGLGALVVVAATTLVAWSWLTGSDNDSSDQVSSAASTPIGPAGTTTPETRPPTTTVAPAPPTTRRPTTTTAVPKRQVLIRGEMKPCRFGANCLVASFTIKGFGEQPGFFTCIYPNSRRDFTFNKDSVDDACITADQGDTITIEVDGVRSAAISEQELGGT